MILEIFSPKQEKEKCSKFREFPDRRSRAYGEIWCLVFGHLLWRLCVLKSKANQSRNKGHVFKNNRGANCQIIIAINILNDFPKCFNWRTDSHNDLLTRSTHIFAVRTCNFAFWKQDDTHNGNVTVFKHFSILLLLYAFIKPRISGLESCSESYVNKIK